MTNSWSASRSLVSAAGAGSPSNSRSWASVVISSTAGSLPCGTSLGPVEGELERAIEALLDSRAAGATICPSEAARAVDPEGWRELMPAARAAAGRLADQGIADVTQGGEVVDVRTARGPVRIRRRSS